MKLKQLIAMLICAVMIFSCVNMALAESVAEEANAAAETESVSEDGQAVWTVMIYLCGTDLETKWANATYNLAEIAKTIPNDSVNVVFQTGGTKEWKAQTVGLDIDPDKTQRYHYDSDGYTLDEELPLQNMASGATLTEFVQYSAEHFPAEKYLLVLWDHGGGSQTGLIVDERYDKAIMSLEQMELALKRSDVALEAVLLDTCLMASLETAQALESTTHYLIASEETVPGKGSDYRNWLQYLYDMPECNGKLFGRKVCDSVQQKYAELGRDYNSVTFSVVDLTQIDAVADAFNKVFEELRRVMDEPLNMLAFSMAKERTESYMLSSMIDLGDLVTRARGMGVTNETANALLTALSDAVVYNIRGADHSYSTGLSFYYEPTEDEYYLDHFARNCKNASYLAFIDRVNTGWTAPAWVYEEVEYLPDITYDNYKVETATEVTEDGELQLTVTNAKDAVQAAELVLYACDTDTAEDGKETETWVRLGQDPFGVKADFAAGEFTANVRGKVITISGNLCEVKVLSENSAHTLLQVPMKNESLGKCSLLVLYRNKETNDTENTAGEAVTYDPGAEDFEVLGIQNETNNALPSRSVHEPSECYGLMLTPVMTCVEYPQGTENGTIDGDEFVFEPGLAVEYGELVEGKYAAAFCLRDVFGKSIVTEMVPFEWDGEKAVFVTKASEPAATEEAATEEAATEEAAAEETAGETAA